MYLIREKYENEELVGYLIDEKISGVLIETHFVDKSLHKCSCRYFTESHNCYSHFHINLCRNWIKNGKPQCAMYAKSKDGKIVTLCPGFIPSK